MNKSDIHSFDKDLPTFSTEEPNKTGIRSQHMISDALFNLMKRKPFQQITVTEICEEAAIERKTFYRNFELREDIIDFKLDLLCNDYKNELTTLSLENYLYHHFSFIQKNADYFITLYQNGLSSLANVKFSALLPYTMPVWSDDPIEQEYRSAYFGFGNLLQITDFHLSAGEWHCAGDAPPDRL